MKYGSKKWLASYHLAGIFLIDSPSLSFICISLVACFKMPHGHNQHPSRPIDPLEYINDKVEMKHGGYLLGRRSESAR
jgi:hypothetical protein